MREERMPEGALYAWYVVGTMVLCNALSYLDRYIISIMVVPIQKDLGFTDTQMGLAIGPAFILLYALAGLPMGRLADRGNRAWLLGVSLVVWSTGLCLMGVARSYWVLLLGRALIGLGEAAVVPASFSLVSEYFPPERRSRAVAVVTWGIAMGAGIAMFGGGALLELAANYAGRSLPLLGRRPAWGLVLLGVGIAGILIAPLLVTVRDPRRRPEAGADKLAGAGFWRFLREHPSAMGFVLTPYVLLTFVQAAIVPWIPALLTRRHGLAPAQAAMLYGGIILTIPVIFASLGGYLSDRLVKLRADGPFLLLTWLAPFYLPGMLLLTLAKGLPMAIAGLCVINIVGGVCSTTVYATVQYVVPARNRGMMLGLYGTVSQILGIGIGPFVVALCTDQVFHSKALLNEAMLLAVAPGWVIVVVCGVLGRNHFRLLRAKAEGFYDDAQLMSAVEGETELGGIAASGALGKAAPR